MRASLLAYFITALAISSAHASPPAGVNWQPWSAARFTEAKQQNKPVLLYLEAVWCHWCHVMDKQTFTDPAVQSYLREQYIVVRVDHDARPDLAERYRAWGWPAIIVFDGQGNEIVKRAGYIAKGPFLKLLNAIVADPSPEQDRTTTATLSASAASSLAPNVRQTLLRRHIRASDETIGGLKGGQRFVDGFHTEWAMRAGSRGDASAQQRARRTLDGGLKLIDPVWGGAYQYSTYGNWDNAHFEKIMRTQARYLQLYAEAYLQYGDPRYLAGAHAIRDYVFSFWLAKNGAFYTSQDADVIPGKKSSGYFALNDAARRQIGVPRVDTNQYTRENGQMVEGLLTLYEATGEKRLLNVAQTTLQWIESQRRLKNSTGYRHGENDNGGPFLSDTLAVARAQLAAYKAGLGRHYLAAAERSANFIAATFKHPNGGLLTSVPDGSPIQPIRKLEENVSAARFFNLLSHYTGQANYSATATHVMTFLAAPNVALARVEESGILLADDELTRNPTHLNVVENQASTNGQQLYAELLRQPGRYERVEWYNRSEGSLRHDDVPFPTLTSAAAYVCTNNRCSLPAMTTEEIKRTIDLLVHGKGAKSLPRMRLLHK